jgi:hypothetical protein
VKWIGLVVVLIFAAAAGAGGLLFWQGQQPRFEQRGIVFPSKVFSDSQRSIGVGIVYISGTITGDGLAYPNNTYAVTCYEDRRECLVSAVHEIGGNMVGRMDMPYIFPIVKWDPFEIVARDEVTELSCIRTTLTIERKMETALWVEEPVNQTRPNCKNANGKVRKYTIEDSPGWKNIFGKR